MSLFRELCKTDDPAALLREGELRYSEMLCAFCDLDLPEEEAQDLYKRAKNHEEVLSRALKRKVGFRLALVDYCLNVDRKFSCPHIVEYENYRQILSQSILDPLTGLLNRRHFDDQTERELRRSKRYGYALSLFFFDLDDFKAVNDNYGHAVGDMVLRETAEILKNSLRTEDIAARYGGEEFVLLLPQTDIEGAKIIGKRLLEKVRNHSYCNGIHLTFSGGAASYPRHGETVKDLLELADRGLYEVKVRGKNDIIVFKEGRRASKRYITALPLTFEVDGGYSHGGTIQDVSLNGLALETNWEPREGQEINLRLILNMKKEVLEIRARIIWAVKQESGNSFALGAQYQPPDEPQILQNFPSLVAAKSSRGPTP